VIVTPVLDHGLEFFTNVPGYVRSAGVHMSDLYGAYYRELDPKRYDKDPETSNPLVPELGTAWEALLKIRLKKAFPQWDMEPGEFVEPQYGIAYSPDVTIYNGSTKLGEIKLTFMSCREWPKERTNQFPPAADKYLSQMKLYCYCLGVNEAVLMALFVNGAGSFKDRLGPEFRMWNIEFTARELREEWETMTGFAKARRLIV
jgi:hypothetical protein